MLNVEKKVKKYLEAAFMYEEACKAMSIVDDGGVSVIYYKEEVASIRFLFNHHKDNLKDAKDNLRTALYLGIVGGKEIQKTEFGFTLQDSENKLDEDSAMEYIEETFELYGAKQDFISDYESETAYNRFMKFFFGPYGKYVSSKEQTSEISEEAPAAEASMDEDVKATTSMTTEVPAVAGNSATEETCTNGLKKKKYIIITDGSDLKRIDIRCKLRTLFPCVKFFENCTGNDFMRCISSHAKDIRENPEEWLLVMDSKVKYYEHDQAVEERAYRMLRRIFTYLPGSIELDAIIVSAEDVDDYFVKNEYRSYLGSVKYKNVITPFEDYEKLLAVKQ